MQSAVMDLPSSNNMVEHKFVMMAIRFLLMSASTTVLKMFVEMAFCKQWEPQLRVAMMETLGEGMGAVKIVL